MPFNFQLVLAVFEFGNLPMLGWLAAGALPWLIHRWNRRQHQTIPWAAVDLLLTAVGQQSQQAKLQQWLLIAVRTAILLLVALAAAEPATRQWALGAASTGRTHTVIVVDRSYSMGMLEQGISPFDQAQTQARRVVESRSPGDVFSLIGWSHSADNVLARPTTDVSLVLSALGSLVLSDEGADLSVAVRAAQAAIERADSETGDIGRHEVVFLSDLARNTWQGDSGAQSSLAGLASLASLTVLDVGLDAQDNIAVIDLTVEPTVLLLKQEVSFSATLRAFGTKGPQDLNVELSIDGRVVDTRQTSLETGDVQSLDFTYSFVQQGTHTVQVAIVGEVDGLAVDNRRRLVVEVRPQLRVACVAAVPGAADDVARALAPEHLPANQTQPFLADIVPLSSLGELDLSGYDVVFLCGAADLNQRETAQVVRFVQAGGALIVLLGEQAPSESLGQVLPVNVLPPAPDGDYRFDVLDYRHRVIAPFRGNANAGLLNVAVMKYNRLELKPERQSVEQVLAFNTGDPALVVDDAGLGRTAILALPGSLATRTAQGSPWSSFAVNPSFLPVIRELANYVTGSSWLAERNLQVGQSATYACDPSQALSQISVRKPDGAEAILSAFPTADQGLIVIPETTMSGIYQLTQADKLLAQFAVNVDARESDLARIEQESLPVEMTLGFADQSPASSTTLVDQSFVSLLLSMVLGLLLVELSLGCWLGRRWQ